MAPPIIAAGIAAVGSIFGGLLSHAASSSATPTATPTAAPAAPPPQAAPPVSPVGSSSQLKAGQPSFLSNAAAAAGPQNLGGKTLLGQ